MSVRVLVIEQTDALREAFVDALSRAGMDVFTAKTVPEAVAVLPSMARVLWCLICFLSAVTRLPLWQEFWAHDPKHGSSLQRPAANGIG
ncbi:MAG: hypothetical protein QNK92_06910 [Amylibacter sp.]